MSNQGDMVMTHMPEGIILKFLENAAAPYAFKLAFDAGMDRYGDGGFEIMVTLIDHDYGDLLSRAYIAVKGRRRLRDKGE